MGGIPREIRRSRLRAMMTVWIVMKTSLQVMMTQILMMMVMEKVKVKKVKADCDSLQQIFTESKMDTSKPQSSYNLIFNCELSMIYILQMRIHQSSVFFTL